MMSVVLKKERPPLPEMSDGGGSAVLVPLIERCWAHEPRERPSFAELVELDELAPPNILADHPYVPDPGPIDRRPEPQPDDPEGAM